VPNTCTESVRGKEHGHVAVDGVSHPRSDNRLELRATCENFPGASRQARLPCDATAAHLLSLPTTKRQRGACHPARGETSNEKCERRDQASNRFRPVSLLMMEVLVCVLQFPTPQKQAPAQGWCTLRIRRVLFDTRSGHTRRIESNWSARRSEFQVIRARINPRARRSRQFIQMNGNHAPSSLHSRLHQNAPTTTKGRPFP